MATKNQPATIGRINTLEDKFMYELGAIYDAEHHFLEAQQQMVQQATNDQLKSMIEMHIGQTQEQITNLEQVFIAMAEAPKRVSCEAAAAMVSDAQKLMKAIDQPEILDTAMAGAQAKVEHFEITCYRSLILGAEQMGNNPILELLRQNLQQEEQTAQTVEQCLPQLLQQVMLLAQPVR